MKFDRSKVVLRVRNVQSSWELTIRYSSDGVYYHLSSDGSLLNGERNLFY